MLTRPSSTSTDRLAKLTLLTAATGLLVCGGLAITRVTPEEACTARVHNLEPHARTLAARRIMHCLDYESGRISKQQYLDAIGAIDLQFSRAHIADGRFERVTWASSVLGFSTQYSATSWSAAQALGAPNVYPQDGDLAQAWASSTADGQPEWIELGYDTPRPVSAVEIYETYNPGAVETVELITTSGRRIELRPASEQPTVKANKLVIETQCTSEPIAAVRINVASTTVEGWNEIDAVGLVPCAEQ